MGGPLSWLWRPKPCLSRALAGKGELKPQDEMTEEKDGRGKSPKIFKEKRGRREEPLKRNADAKRAA
jgi:hypothetical protein